MQVTSIQKHYKPTSVQLDHQYEISLQEFRYLSNKGGIEHQDIQFLLRFYSV